MKTIADALVYAVTYINLRDSEGDDDADVGALESIAGFLQEATEPELDQLAAAAKRALAAEKSLAMSREEFVHDYASWMEDMFGEEWQGNERSSPQ